ncbi:MAG: hypothetical protein WC300_06040, partial [Candidatus Omnitrophota bacterium]
KKITDTTHEAAAALQEVLDQYKDDLYTSEQGPSSFIDGKSWKDIYLVCRQLAEYMLPANAGTIYAKVLMESGSNSQAGWKDALKTPEAAKTLDEAAKEKAWNMEHQYNEALGREQDDLQKGTLTVDAAKILLSSAGRDGQTAVSESEVDEFMKFLAANNMVSNGRLTHSGMILFGMANTLKERFFGLPADDPDRQALTGLLFNDGKQPSGIFAIVEAIANRAGMISRLTGFDLENLILLAREVSAIRSEFNGFELELDDITVIVSCTRGPRALLIGPDDPEYRLSYARGVIKNRLIELSKDGKIRHDLFSNNIQSDNNKLSGVINTFEDIEVRVALECAFLPDIAKAMDEIRAQNSDGYKTGLEDLEAAARLTVDFYSRRDAVKDKDAYDKTMPDKARTYITAWAKAAGRDLTDTELRVLEAIVQKIFLDGKDAASLSYTTVHELARDVYAAQDPAR